jgi:hypothetical protein
LSIIASMKGLFGNYFLRQEMTGLSRNRDMVSLADAKTIGIVFEATDKEEFELVKKYVLYLREQKKKVKAIGYFSGGETPAFTFSKLEYDFFSKKDLNWYYKPNDKFVHNFILEEFDILIDLNIHGHFAMKYVSGTSRARFKVGQYNKEDESIFDLMIEGAEDKGLKYYLRQVDTYLQMLNKDKSDSNA